MFYILNAKIFIHGIKSSHGKDIFIHHLLKIHKLTTGINSLMSFRYSLPSELETVLRIAFLGNGKHGPFILLLLTSAILSHLSLFSM